MREIERHNDTSEKYRQKDTRYPDTYGRDTKRQKDRERERGRNTPALLSKILEHFQNRN
jgi:hypothetical protein